MHDKYDVEVANPQIRYNQETSTWDRYQSWCRNFEQVEYVPLLNLKKMFIQ